MRNRFADIDMGVDAQCYACFLRQARIALEMAGVDGNALHTVMRGALGELEQADYSKTPAHVSSAMHRRLREMLGADPFAANKTRYNAIALEMYPELRRKVAGSHKNSLLIAARLAIAGNVIDFGIYSEVDITGTVERALGEPMAVDDGEEFLRAVDQAEEVLYLLDNAGEVVFDRLLIEELLSAGKRVTTVVKAGPVLNDCTAQDAIEAGLDLLVEVVDTGSDHVGTILEFASPEFRALFERSGQLIISKGQGNFETLMHEEQRKIFFLLQAKCAVVARLLGLPEGAMLLADGGGSAQ